MLVEDHTELPEVEVVPLLAVEVVVVLIVLLVLKVLRALVRIAAQVLTVANISLLEIDCLIGQSANQFPS